jgi:phage baseplate assembly protein W
MDRATGQPLSGWDHVAACIGRILTTRIGERVMRRQFGFGGLSLLGRRFTPQVIALYRLHLVLALEAWEPRIRVKRIAVGGEVDAIRDGHPTVSVTADYMPRGHLGDTTVAMERDIAVS